MPRSIKLSVPFFALLACIIGAASVRGQGGTWEALASMPAPRQEIAVAVLQGQVYVLGGYDANGASTATVFVYNPVTDTWTSGVSLPSAVNHNSAAVVADRLYSFGGAGRSVAAYTPGSGAWAFVAPMHFEHGETAAVGVFEDKIYVAGGQDNGVNLRELEVYDPVANTWTLLASMSIARNHIAGAFIAGKFYVAGGRGGVGAPTALEVYNPQTNSWSSLAPMPTGRSGIAAAAINGELFVFGGEIPTIHGAVEVYNPQTNTWRSLAPMPLPLHGTSAGVIGNRVYLPGGGAAQGLAATSANQLFTVDIVATFANISTRLNVQTVDNVLIGGFIVTGDGAKRVMVRAVGPSTALPGVLADPVLEFYDGAGQLVAASDNWEDAPNSQEMMDSGLAPTDEAEAAILTSVDPGNYTAIVQGAGGSTGIGLVEVYDLEAGSDSKLANISTRGFVQTDDDVMIGGLILTGSDPADVIVRAIGPSLAVPGPLANPTLELRDANGGLLAANDDWRSTQEQEILATNLAPASDLESAILRTLPAASYTAIVRGVNGTTGIALVEAYNL